ncbi:MAG: macro domain-containing protein [Desulfobacterales bacterium]|nr:MAG: macro domain-containing protein [Desulfobacterales bacterium]
MNQKNRRRPYSFKDSTLFLEFADITTSEAQVLVSSDDSYLTMGGGVSAAIRRAGGNAIALDVAKKIPVALGDVAVTTAGSLQAHYIFHAVTLGKSKEKISPRQVIEMATRRCMQLVSALRVQSIAFPALGAGFAGFTYEDVAASMAGVIADELSRSERPVEAGIYLYDPLRPNRFDPFAFAEEFARRETLWQAIPDSAKPDDSRSSAKEVFISYSHKDQKWLKRLQDMLKPLLRKGSVSIWDDTTIKAGAAWRAEIEEALKSAKAAVLLVSSDFLASEFIAENELPQLLAAARRNDLKILWVLISPCMYKQTKIKDYQAAHDISKPLAGLKRTARDNALVEVCQNIKAAVSV